MKRYILLIIALTSLAAKAQNITIHTKAISLKNDTILIDMQITAENLEIKSNRSLSLDMIFKSTDQQQRLPMVVFAGGQRYKLDSRASVLASGQSPETFAVYKNVKPNQVITVDYKVSVPYQDWMRDADICVNQVMFDCCNEWLVSEESRLAKINVVQDQDKPWSADPMIYSRMIAFMTPEVERVKNRVASAVINIDYPVNVSTINPEYGNNRNELMRVDTIMRSVMNSELIEMGLIRLTGYASPEGSYNNNESLARNRAWGFKKYLSEKYLLGKHPIYSDWVAEDWESVIIYLNQNEGGYNNQMLEIIENTTQYDQREKNLKALAGGVPFDAILKDLFVKLRRIEFRVDYVVSNLSDAQARELLYTRPELLSLEEMYRVASYYKPGSGQYREVYEIAAKHFPNDIIANNNAAAAALLAGDTATAASYLDKIQDGTHSYINKGVLHYINGDIEQAEKYFRMATEAGHEVGGRNLELLK